MICLNCGEKMKEYFKKKEFDIAKCPACSLMAVENVPEDLSKYYSEGYFTGDTALDGYIDYDLDKEVTKKTYLNFLGDIEKFLPDKKNRSMFEVGCATGFFLALAVQHGWQAEGIDISEFAVQKAVAKGLKAKTATIENFNSESTYDAVVMQDVIEHVKDPDILVTRSRDLLKENGLLVLTTPDAGSHWARIWGKKWHAFVPPQHLFYFSADNLSSMLKSRGFEVIYLEHHGKWFTIPYIVRLLYSWTGLAIFSALAGRLSGTPLRRISIPINVRDTIYLIARKK